MFVLYVDAPRMLSAMFAENNSPTDIDLWHKWIGQISTYKNEI